MGMQLIIVVETNKKCNSDWIYIKDTIEHFYSIDNARTKLTPIYMDGKGKYRKKQREVEEYIKKYSKAADENESHVIYCFDCDNYDINNEDSSFLDEVSRYCQDNDYNLVWFCKDIESVYLKKKVDAVDKKKTAANFKANRMIDNISINSLNSQKYKVGTSNIVDVLDRYLKRKS
ncbi:MAG: hypothetical protein MSA91_10235 [Lachnobacterium sp.]|nr:hypothetical protein [Lachnobacterium sp.]MDY2911551.1 hypothetical protein [Agathobacter sp.]